MKPSEKQNVSFGIIILAMIVLLFVSWNSAGAQADPPPVTPEISATWWVPTPSPLPTTRPLIVPCPPWMSCAWLPLVVTP